MLLYIIVQEYYYYSSLLLHYNNIIRVQYKNNQLCKLVFTKTGSNFYVTIDW